MKRLIRHIERLLYREPCVVVPNLGAFIRHTEESVVDHPKGLIYPSRSRISFNSALAKDDGILVRSYSEAYSYGYKRSLRLLEKDVEEVKSELLSSGVVQMGEVGQLLRSRNGQLSFFPNDNHPFSVDTYGLQPVAMLPPIGTNVTPLVSKNKARRDGDIYYLPINIRHLAYGGVAVALTAIALLIPNDKLASPQDLQQYEAGFVAVQNKALVTSPIPEVVTTKVVEPVESQEVLPTIYGYPLMSEADEEGRYYVVIATLSGEEEMRRFLEENSSFDAFIDKGGILVSKSGMYRLFAESFADEAEARDYLRELRTHAPFSTSWLYRH